MHRSGSRFSGVSASIIVAILIALALMWFGCSERPETATAPARMDQLASKEPAAPEQVRATMEIQDRHTDHLLTLKGVVGTATGLTKDGELAIKVYVAEAGVTDVPETLDGVPVIVQVTGNFFAVKKPGGKPGKPGGKEPSGKGKFDRPVPIGVSVGNLNECSSGTIGCAADNGGDRYILSNNHVLARENRASIGEDIVQPGVYDNKPRCRQKPENKIGDLSDFEPITFSQSANNVIDAAIALSSTSNLACSTYTSTYGYPSSTNKEATLDMGVQKVGRTTGHTTGTITGINVTVLVSYSSGIARFVDQIEITGNRFLISGDSGSLLVTDDDNKNPVGLLFASNSTGSIAIANRIAPVLSRFGLTICSQ